MNIRIGAYIICILILPGCAIHEAAFLGKPLEYDSTQTEYFDQKEYVELTEFIDKNSPTTGMMVLQDGKVIFQYGDIKKVSYIASCRKSVLSMLYGKYVDEGMVDLNCTIGELGIDEKDGLLPREKEAAVNDIITSRSGVFHRASNAGYDKDNFLERGSVEPGDYFVYNNWDFNVAGHIFEQYAKKSIYEELELQFAIPLGFQDWNIKNQKKSGNKSKSHYLAYHMYLSTRDMVKLGQLMLNEGAWDGKQLLSKEWIKKTTSAVTPAETIAERYGQPGVDDVHMSYGYMWWLIEKYKGKKEYEGGYSAIGYGGQYITVLPEIDVVIAHKTKLNLWMHLGLGKDGDKEYWNIVERVVNSLQNKSHD